MLPPSRGTHSLGDRSSVRIFLVTVNCFNVVDYWGGKQLSDCLFNAITFLKNLASAFYTQFDTHRRGGGDFASFCGANKIICLNVKATQVLAKCAVVTSFKVNLVLRNIFWKSIIVTVRAE